MSDPFQMRREVIEIRQDRIVVLLDTIAHVEPQDEGRIVVAGSHGGISSGEYASRVKVKAVFFNDAGGGKDGAGRAALPFLDEVGIAAGTVSHDSAMIGDARGSWDTGVISAVNSAGERIGFRVGRPLSEQVAALPESDRAA